MGILRPTLALAVVAMVVVACGVDAVGEASPPGTADAGVTAPTGSTPSATVTGDVGSPSPPSPPPGPAGGPPGLGGADAGPGPPSGPPGMTCLAPQAPCTANGDCCDAWCYPDMNGSHYCAPACSSQLGGPCQLSYECCGGFCELGSCAACFRAGTICYASERDCNLACCSHALTPVSGGYVCN